MSSLDLFKQTIKTVSDDKLNETISKGALKLTDEQIATVSFVFWLVYMAEIDLKDILSKAWNNSKQFFPTNVNQGAKGLLLKMISDQKNIDIENLEYFSDKIKIYEVMVGKTKHAELLHKLKDLRNDISHNRINELKYNNEDLFLRATKEKILIDYFETETEDDLSRSDIWNSLTEEQKIQIKQMHERFSKDVEKIK